MATDEERDGVRLSSLDSPLGDGLDVTKRDLVDHLDAFADRLVPLLADRSLTVKRVRPGAEPFIQRDVPKGAPEWVRTVATWSDRARREVQQVLVEDRRTLLWLAPGGPPHPGSTTDGPAPLREKGGRPFVRVRYSQATPSPFASRSLLYPGSPT